MFSYRHGFHAGNHADVLKHLVQVQLLAHLTAKDKPFWVIDTHAGGGRYRLDEGYAAKSGESASGIRPLWEMPNLPPALTDYLAAVRLANPDGSLRWYPGSPDLTMQVLRTQDRLHVFEKHPTEINILREWAAPFGRRVQVHDQDGFTGIKALLPPAPRRALVLIDPSYEIKSDYDAVLTMLGDAFRRFATGVYAVWYPLVQRPESRQFGQRLQALAQGDWLHATLSVKSPEPGGIGLHGSGMFVFNPPWKLESALRPALATLERVLGQDSGATHTLHWKQS